MDANDELFDDWRITYVEPGSGLEQVMRARSRLRLERETGTGRVHISLAESLADADERMDWSCECEQSEFKGTRVAVLKGHFSPEHDPHEHEVTIVCVHFPRGGRVKGHMTGHVRHEDPAIPHFSGVWHAEH